MRIDLHVHSTASDGTASPAEVVTRAAARGLDVLALTDHDTTAGLARAASALPDGLTLLSGAEISCRIGRRSVHLLAYLFDPDEPQLAAELARLRRDRVRRGREMVRRVNALGVSIRWERVSALADGGVVGRPHVARALLEAGAVRRYEDAFSSAWLAPGGRAYVERHALDPRHAVELVRAAGGVSVLAHPRLRPTVSDQEIAELAAAGLTGVEVDHPDQGPAARAALRGLAGDLGLAVTGGSDDHGELTGFRMGAETTSAVSWERLLAAATGATPLRRSAHP